MQDQQTDGQGTSSEENELNIMDAVSPFVSSKDQEDGGTSGEVGQVTKIIMEEKLYYTILTFIVIIVICFRSNMKCRCWPRSRTNGF